MTLLDTPISWLSPLPALVWTTGLSTDAEFVDRSAQASLENFRRAYSLDDGRRGVQEELARQQGECALPGWDGYGAEPVTLDTFRLAYRFVEALPPGFPMPSVGAEADGHLTLEWYQNPSRVVSVSIGPEGDVHYAALLGGGARRNGTEPFLGEVPRDLLQIIHRVMSA